MRMMVYRGTGGLTVVGDGFGRTFVGVPPDAPAHQFVDFDEVVAQIVREVETPNQDGPPTLKKKKTAVTWEDAIGKKYTHLFEPAPKPGAKAAHKGKE